MTACGADVMAYLDSTVRELKAKLHGSRLQVALAPLLHSVLQHVPHHNDDHIHPRQLVFGESGGYIDCPDRHTHSQAGDGHADQVRKQEALRQQLRPDNDGGSGVVLESLDAVGVLLVAAGVVGNNDALIVATPPTLLLHHSPPCCALQEGSHRFMA